MPSDCLERKVIGAGWVPGANRGGWLAGTKEEEKARLEAEKAHKAQGESTPNQVK